MLVFMPGKVRMEVAAQIGLDAFSPHLQRLPSTGTVSRAWLDAYAGCGFS